MAVTPFARVGSMSDPRTPRSCPRRSAEGAVGDGGRGGRTRPTSSRRPRSCGSASMIKQLLDEVRNTTLDEAGPRAAHATSTTPRSTSSARRCRPTCGAELERVALPFDDDTEPSDAELRIAQAQLVGWLEGPVPRHPGHAVRPADGGAQPARGHAGPGPASSGRLAGCEPRRPGSSGGRRPRLHLRAVSVTAGGSVHG